MGVLAAGCEPDAPLVTAVNTLCTSTTRDHTTPDQKAVYAAKAIVITRDDDSTAALGSGEAVFGPHVRWLLGFNRVRDGECLQPSKGN